VGGWRRNKTLYLGTIVEVNAGHNGDQFVIQFANGDTPIEVNRRFATRRARWRSDGVLVGGVV